jgi:sec-independent protein translocase protein TatB
MDIFGIGILEMLIICLVIVIVAGPKRSAIWARQAGLYFRQFRLYVSQMMSEIEREVDPETRELMQVAREFRQTTKDIRQMPRQVIGEIEETVRKMPSANSTSSATPPVQDTPEPRTYTDWSPSNKTE